MGKPHSFRKYKKQIKYKYGRWWDKNWKWPGNFHPREVNNMTKFRPFYIPNKHSARVSSVFDLTEAQYKAIAKPFLEVSYRKIKRK